ncbi:UNVERIFIED_CONTAM: protein CURVATURE THYLAKOID 1B, chloroplastic [Sesamum radiatum]|uniref:Protein CURVATURE THYLAKOID 1B, chloroplastic n=1 Tax=Sesamum radiatum TaxID=300843 RepID=A0AAW2VIQ9_SESRA
MMASTTPTSTPLSLSSSALLNAKAPSPPARLQPTPVAAPSPPPAPSHSHSHSYLSKTNAYCRKIARNVVSMATGEAPADVVATAETPEIIKTIQEAWDKVEDKYAVSSLAVAGGVALWASAGMISAIDRLPLVPGVLEIVGIGYTGWFAYRNLVFKPDRNMLLYELPHMERPARFYCRTCPYVCQIESKVKIKRHLRLVKKPIDPIFSEDDRKNLNKTTAIPTTYNIYTFGLSS